MPDEITDTEADESQDEHLEEEAVEDESSTEGDDALTGLLGQLHEGAPLDEDEEDEEVSSVEEEGEVEESGLTPSAQHSLAVATKKQERIDKLEGLLADSQGATDDSNSRLARLEKLVLDQAARKSQEKVQVQQQTRAEQKAERVASIVNMIEEDGKVDFVTGDPTKILSRIVSVMQDANDTRTQEWLGQNDELLLLQESRLLSNIIGASDSLTRFVQHPETTKQLRAMKLDREAMQEAYSDPDKNRQKAMLLDVMTARADRTERQISGARDDRRRGRKANQGAFSAKGANRTPSRTRKRGESLMDKTAKMSEEEFGNFLAVESKRAEAREADMAPGL